LFTEKSTRPHCLFSRSLPIRFLLRSLQLIVAIGLVAAVCALTGCGGTTSKSTQNTPPLAIVTTSLPNGTVGAPYSALLVATGGISPYNWSITSGSLPAGLTLSASTGTIGGTPIASASAVSLTFSVMDSAVPAQSTAVTLSLTIGPSGTTPLAITTTSLPNGQVGSAYSATLTATGGTTPYTWSLAPGTLPAGLAFNVSTGAITGTPSAVANAIPLSFEVADSSNPVQTQSVSVTLTIAGSSPAPLSIVTTSLPNGQVGNAYSTTLAATGGTTPYTWSITLGTLPSGLNLTASSGVISGTPTAAASAVALTFTVTDSSSPAQTQSVTLTLTVAANSSGPLTITTSSLPEGQAGVSYSASLLASGGTSPYTWILTSGVLPAGLTLTSTGVIGGTPTAAANAVALAFAVTDAESPAQTRSVSLTLTIEPPALAITTTSLPNGQVGSPYGGPLAASGGTPPYTWTLTSGTLLAGLTLNSSTGLISGVPTALASAVVLTFTVSDSEIPAQTKSVNLTLTIAANSIGPLTITSTMLPSGQVGNTYSAILTATGGTTPYTWTLTAGTPPAGLAFNPTSAAIAGTPTATANAVALSFKVTDSSNPVQTQSVNLVLNISPSTITVSVSPTQVGLAINQTLALTPTTNDFAGVNWSCGGSACGTFSATNTVSGTAVSYTAPATAGLYTIAATSATNNSVTATVSVAVTDLAGVTTYHNDLSRDGANTQEYLLSPSNVTSSNFGKLFSCSVDEAIYAQPLWVPNVAIGSTQHNMVFVATQNNSLFAFDADNPGTPCAPLWQVSLLDSSHGGTPGETPVPSGPNALIGGPNGDITPEVGVTGTPVIDPTTNTLYVVSKSVIQSGPTFFQRFHAIDLATGSEKFSGPAAIDDSIMYPGTGDGGLMTVFSPGQEHQRSGLLFLNGIVYVAWASLGDVAPFHGWLVGFDASDLSQAPVYILNVTPDGTEGGIWMSGGAPSVDSAGNIYLITGNGTFDANNPTSPNDDYGDSLIKITPTLAPDVSVTDYFTPSDQAYEAANDKDFGSGGAAVLVDLPQNGSNPTQLVVGAGKDGTLYVLNRQALGHLGDQNAWQTVNVGEYVFSTAAFWNNNLYLSNAFGPMQAYTLSPQTAQFTAGLSTTPASYGFFGPTPSVSSMPDNSNGILWLIDSSQYCTNRSPGCGPAVLHAYDATNLGTEFWNSSMGTGNAAGNAVKFTVPTIANGKVYIGTRGNNIGGADGSTTVNGELDIFGLLPN